MTNSVLGIFGQKEKNKFNFQESGDRFVSRKKYINVFVFQ